MKAKAGQLICIDHGEYSDYTVDGFFVALCAFDPMEELQKFLDANEPMKTEYHFDQSKFLAHLLAQGFLLEIEYATLYLGSYSSADGVSFTGHIKMEGS